MDSAVQGKDAVRMALPENRAIASLLALNADAVLDAKYHLKELTVTIARDEIRGACEAVKAAGYNFLEDVTCVDWYPSEPRFHVTYHILSHSLKDACALLAQSRASIPRLTALGISLAILSAKCGTSSACVSMGIRNCGVSCCRKSGTVIRCAKIIPWRATANAYKP